MPKPDAALTTRVSEETFWALKAEAVETRRTVQNIVEAALRHYLGLDKVTETDA